MTCRTPASVGHLAAYKSPAGAGSNRAELGDGAHASDQSRPAGKGTRTRRCTPAAALAERRPTSENLAARCAGHSAGSTRGPRQGRCLAARSGRCRAFAAAPPGIRTSSWHPRHASTHHAAYVSLFSRLEDEIVVPLVLDDPLHLVVCIAAGWAGEGGGRWALGVAAGSCALHTQGFSCLKHSVALNCSGLCAAPWAGLGRSRVARRQQAPAAAAVHSKQRIPPRPCGNRLFGRFQHIPSPRSPKLSLLARHRHAPLQRRLALLHVRHGATIG